MVRHLNTNYGRSRKKFEETKSCISNMHDDFIHLITQVEGSINPEYANEIKLLTVGVLGHLWKYDRYAYGRYEVDGELTSTPSTFPPHYINMWYNILYIYNSNISIRK